jgi:hypothetical protein
MPSLLTVFMSSENFVTTLPQPVSFTRQAVELLTGTVHSQTHTSSSRKIAP